MNRLLRTTSHSDLHAFTVRKPRHFWHLSFCRITVVSLSHVFRSSTCDFSSTILHGGEIVEALQVYWIMRVNAELVVELRKERSWSQDELATAAGLNLRTIQRIENVGTASLQSIKSIASALEAEFEDFIPEKPMGRFEYKTVVLPFRIGIFKKGLPDIQEALNTEGREGWQFKQIILPSSEWGKSDNIVAILERPIE